MEATDENILMNPDSTIEIQVQCNTNDSGNENDGAILKKSDSVNSDDDIALTPLATSIEETDKALDSAGQCIKVIGQFGREKTLKFSYLVTM